MKRLRRGWKIAAVLLVLALVLAAVALLFPQVMRKDEGRGNVTETPVAAGGTTPVGSPVPTVVIPVSPTGKATKTSLQEIATLFDGQMLRVSFPVRFFQYPWGDHVLSAGKEFFANGVLIYDDAWYALSIPPAVKYCEHVVVSVPEARERTFDVHPQLTLLPIRKVSFVPGDMIRWGCKTWDIFFTSATGPRGVEFTPTDEGMVANIVPSPDGVSMLVVQGCTSAAGGYIVNRSRNGERVRVDVSFFPNWVVFGDFVCSGGEHPNWKMCVDWWGEPVSPQFPEYRYIEIEE